MIFSLDVRRARKGDCLLLQFGTKAEPGLIMIDGGPKGVYTPHLKPRIAEIRKARKLDEDTPLPVDLLMVSHVDDDHIQGLLELTKEMIAAADQGEPLPLSVSSVWHNSFDAVIGNDPEELTAAFKSRFGPASTGGAPPDDLELDADDAALDAETIRAGLKVLASIEQGARLRSDVERLHDRSGGAEFAANPEFDGKLVIARNGAAPIGVGAGLTFTVAGPMAPEVKKLHDKHEAWLKTQKKKSPEAALAAYLDKSVPNLSSLVVLAEAEGQRMLLTGDARGDKILEGLELVGALQTTGDMHIDLLKVPHHGSANNLETGFFERITADHYVFSGNGEHGNPERLALEMLVEARGDQDYTIHLTYPVAEIDAARKDDWQKEQAKETARKKKKPRTKVREDWAPAKHGLAAFFTDHPGLKNGLKIVDAEKPHIIDLADKLSKTWPGLDV